MSVGGVGFVKIDHSEVVDVIDHDFIKNAWARGAISRAAKLGTMPHAPIQVKWDIIFLFLQVSPLAYKEYAL